MVLGSQLQFARYLIVIYINLIVLGALHLNLTFEVVAVVQIERQQAHALAVLERGQYLTTERGGGLGGECETLKEALLIKFLALHIDRINTQGCVHGKGTSQIKLFHFGLDLCRGHSTQHQERP